MKKAKLILTFALSILIFLAMGYVEPTYMSYFKKKDIYTLLNAILFWSTIKYLLLGLTLGAIFTIIRRFYVTLISVELRIERLFLKNKYVLTPEYPKPTLDLILRHSYFLFAPIVIGVRLFSSSVHMSALELYLFIGDIVRNYIWLVFLLIVAPYITIEYSRVRLYNNKKQTLNYPSYLMTLISIAVLGAGSIASLIPLYYDLLAITHDPKTALNLFIYGIAIYFVPALFTIFGVYLAIFVILKRNIIHEDSLENLIEAIIKIENKRT